MAAGWWRKAGKAAPWRNQPRDLALMQGATVDPAQLPKKRRKIEAPIQEAVKRVLADLDYGIYDTSQPFAAAITAGVPDLICLAGERTPPHLPRVLFVEVKAPKGSLSDAQRVFRDRCQRWAVAWIMPRSAADVWTQLGEAP